MKAAILLIGPILIFLSVANGQSQATVASGTTNNSSCPNKCTLSLADKRETIAICSNHVHFSNCRLIRCKVSGRKGLSCAARVKRRPSGSRKRRKSGSKGRRSKNKRKFRPRKPAIGTNTTLGKPANPQPSKNPLGVSASNSSITDKVNTAPLPAIRSVCPSKCFVGRRSFKRAKRICRKLAPFCRVKKCKGRRRRRNKNGYRCDIA